MCMGGTPKAKPPATPPPPPPVLEQQAPETTATSNGATQSKKASGSKAYRNPLAIKGSPTQAGNTGLSISK